MELVGLLCDVPQSAESLDMDDVAQRLALDRWLTVIAAQPQLEKYFDWTVVEKKPSLYWDVLLRHQPQFACHCDPEQLKAWQIRRIQSGNHSCSARGKSGGIAGFSVSP